MTFDSMKIVRGVAVAAALALPLAAIAASADNVTVVYVSGTQVVVNQANGKDYSYTVGAGDTVTTAGGSMPVSGLKPGTVITGGLNGSRKAVEGADVVKGTVVSVEPPDKAVVKVDGENKEVSLAAGDLAGMKVGDSVDLTLVTVRTPGDNRPMYSIKAPPLTGKLAFFQMPNMEEPDSGTNLPTYGLVGGLLLAVGFGLGMRRKVTN